LHAVGEIGNMYIAQKARSKPRDQRDQAEIGPPQMSHLLAAGNETVTTNYDKNRTEYIVNFRSPWSMNEHQRETAFLRQIIAFDDTDERHELERRIEEVQREERCIKRVASLMVLLGGLGLAGLAYGALFAESFAYGNSQFYFKGLCTMGLASLISLAMLACFLIGCRQKLNAIREECRRLIKRLLESRIGNPHPHLAYLDDPRRGDKLRSSGTAPPTQGI
jgi:hypothetical protein